MPIKKSRLPARSKVEVESEVGRGERGTVSGLISGCDGAGLAVPVDIENDTELVCVFVVVVACMARVSDNIIALHEAQQKLKLESLWHTAARTSRGRRCQAARSRGQDTPALGAS